MNAKLITTCAVMHMAGPTPDEHGRVIVGHCPACHDAVCDDGSKPSDPPTPDDAPVWTCPTDLSDENPHHVDRDDRITDAVQERAGCFGNCLDDFGNLGPCPHERMPLHSACYQSDAITY